jgi:hypothetical protein
MIKGTPHKTTKCGDLVIDEYITAHNVRVTFKETGYSTTAIAGNIRKGTVTDKTARNVHGVGYIGTRIRTGERDELEKLAYRRWTDMLRRCYCEVFHETNKTYKGCEVCLEWQEFHVFEEWFRVNYIEAFEIDKDIEINGNKTYCPEACSFVSKADNLKACARDFCLISPSGHLVTGNNVTEFCNLNGLIKQGIYNVLNGKRKSHKGWTRAI